MIMNQEKESLINLNLPKQEKTEFKVRCERSGYNMREALRHLVRQINSGSIQLPRKT